MKNFKSEQIIAAGHHVAIGVELDRFNSPENSLEREELYMCLNGSFHIGEILNFGEKATDENWCPELKDPENKYAIIGDFDGYTPPTQDKYLKVVPAHSIIAITTKYKDMTIEDIKPTSSRILVKILEEDSIVNGFQITDNEDPRNAQVQSGIILKIADSAQIQNSNLKVGMMVSFDPYVGNLIVHTSENKIKTLNINDVLYYTTE